MLGRSSTEGNSSVCDQQNQLLKGVSLERLGTPANEQLISVHDEIAVSSTDANRAYVRQPHSSLIWYVVLYLLRRDIT